MESSGWRVSLTGPPGAQAVTDCGAVGDRSRPAHGDPHRRGGGGEGGCSRRRLALVQRDEEGGGEHVPGAEVVAGERDLGRRDSQRAAVRRCPAAGGCSRRPAVAAARDSSVARRGRCSITGWAPSVTAATAPAARARASCAAQSSHSRSLSTHASQRSGSCSSCSGASAISPAASHSRTSPCGVIPTKAARPRPRVAASRAPPGRCAGSRCPPRPPRRSGRPTRAPAGGARGRRAVGLQRGGVRGGDHAQVELVAVGREQSVDLARVAAA